MELTKYNNPVGSVTSFTSSSQNQPIYISYRLVSTNANKGKFYVMDVFT